MSNYIVFDTTSLNIVKTGICPSDSVTIQAGEGQLALEGYGLPETHKVELDGEIYSIVEKTEQEKKEYIYTNMRDIPISLDLKWTKKEEDSAIEEYYMGMVDVNEWREKNYEKVYKLAIEKALIQELNLTRLVVHLARLVINNDKSVKSNLPDDIANIFTKLSSLEDLYSDISKNKENKGS
jgi:hypothetical protein